MSFEAVEFVAKNSTQPTASLSYMKPKGRGTSGGQTRAGVRPQLVISVPTTICGVGAAETFALLVGREKERGKLRIKGLPKKERDAGIEPRQMKHCFQFHFGYVPALGDDIFGKDRFPIRKSADDEYEIDIPQTWFDAPETD